MVKLAALLGGEGEGGVVIPYPCAIRRPVEYGSTVLVPLRSDIPYS